MSKLSFLSRGAGCSALCVALIVTMPATPAFGQSGDTAKAAKDLIPARSRATVSTLGAKVLLVRPHPGKQQVQTPTTVGNTQPQPAANRTSPRFRKGRSWSAPKALPTLRTLAATAVIGVVALGLTACGKKAPPPPPGGPRGVDGWTIGLPASDLPGYSGRSINVELDGIAYRLSIERDRAVDDPNKDGIIVLSPVPQGATRARVSGGDGTTKSSANKLIFQGFSFGDSQLTLYETITQEGRAELVGDPVLERKGVRPVPLNPPAGMRWGPRSSTTQSPATAGTSDTKGNRGRRLSGTESESRLTQPKELPRPKAGELQFNGPENAPAPETAAPKSTEPTMPGKTSQVPLVPVPAIAPLPARQQFAATTSAPAFSGTTYWGQQQGRTVVEDSVPKGYRRVTILDGQTPRTFVLPPDVDKSVLDQLLRSPAR